MHARLQDKLLGQPIAVEMTTRDFGKSVVGENRHQVLMVCWSKGQVTILDSQTSGGVKESDSKNHDQTISSEWYHGK